MFIYQHEFIMSLRTYGIEVPVSGGKIDKFYHFLKTNLPDSILELDCIKSIQSYLPLVHDEKFITNLELDAKNELIKTFELINKENEYHRYDPASAIKDLSLLVGPFYAQTYGTIKACEIALQKGFAYNLGGGYHHAMSFGGRGFCLINDLVIAARVMQTKFNIKQVWIIDIDAHKGDGTAEITQHDPTISTLSIHMKNGWPLGDNPLNKNDGKEPWFISSDIDIEIDQGQEHRYLSDLKDGLTKLLNHYPKPDLAIIVDGSDAYEKDELDGSQFLMLTKEQMLERNVLVYEFLKKNNIPQAYTMSGGYGEHSHEIHTQFIQKIKHELI